jgi:hypothetical protein
MQMDEHEGHSIHKTVTGTRKETTMKAETICHQKCPVRNPWQHCSHQGRDFQCPLGVGLPISGGKSMLVAWNAVVEG